jgi:polyisoprenoid-binding protein YceI
LRSGGSARASTIVVSAALVLGVADGEAADLRAWRVGGSELRVLCPLTVGGSFEAKTSALTGTLVVASSHPLVLSGQLSVDLETLDTGIGLRNDHLRGVYLEVGRGAGFDHATLADIHVGDVDPGAFQGRTPFSGTLRVHGTERPVAGQAQIHRGADGVRVEATFPVSLPDYGIPKPRYLGVGVKDTVKVQVSFEAVPVRSGDGGVQ